MSEPVVQPIIIIKKKIAHAGHHGGAWKVAYADFVTAMMALFIVLWLLSSSTEVKESVSAYFNDPSGSGKMRGSSSAGAGEALALAKDDMENLKDKLDQALKQSPNFEKLKDNIAMSVTGDGLRVELLESEKGMFFQSGSAAPSETGKELIVKLAEELGKLPNDLLIEGHTDAKVFGLNTEYTNWELSTDRANAARRLMEKGGLRPAQVVQVRGFADHSLRDTTAPEAASNRRVSVIVKYQNAAPAPPEHKEEAKVAQTH
ncbi:MAG: flagellar motor protein MotB [Acidobacteriota bacterium]